MVLFLGIMNCNVLFFLYEFYCLGNSGSTEKVESFYYPRNTVTAASLDKYALYHEISTGILCCILKIFCFLRVHLFC